MVLPQLDLQHSNLLKSDNLAFKIAAYGEGFGLDWSGLISETDHNPAQKKAQVDVSRVVD